MAIDLNSVSSSLAPRVRSSEQQAAKSSGTAPQTAASSAVPDRVELSAQAQNLYTNDQGSFDAARVEALKAQIEAGSYQVDHQQLAAKILRFEAGF